MPLANLKTANLFSCRYSSQEQLAGQVLSWHRALESKGVCLRLLRAKNGCALIYVYRPLRLAADLCKPGVAELLAGCGYQSLAPNEALARLSERLCSQEGFPHEIGIFLGYPLEDVKGFIENSGRHFKICGQWKVYSDTKRAEKLFAKYAECSDRFCACLSQGQSIEDLVKAV